MYAYRSCPIHSCSCYWHEGWQTQTENAIPAPSKSKDVDRQPDPLTTSDLPRSVCGKVPIVSKKLIKFLQLCVFSYIPFEFSDENERCRNAIAEIECQSGERSESIEGGC